MLCDELKEYYYYEDRVITPSTHMYRVYHADEADAAIAELKKKLMPCLNGDCILTCEVVEKYGKENAELKAKLENVQASHYAEMVDAGMRERRLKRALWIARAKHAQEMAWNFHEKNIVEKCAKWDNVHLMCRAKAEQYK